MDANTKRRLLEVRAQKKAKQPAFVRMESWRYVRVHPSWRRNKGIDNKTRKKYNNGIPGVDVGYRGPKGVRNLHPSGLEDVVVVRKEDLENLSPKIHGIRIAARLGAKKKVDLIEYVRGKGFHILNIGISEKELTELESPKVTAEGSKKAQIEKLKAKGKTDEKTESPAAPETAEKPAAEAPKSEEKAEKAKKTSKKASSEK